MSEQLSTANLLSSFGIGLLCGYVVTKLFKLRANATSLFVATLLAVCSTWLGKTCSILNIDGVLSIGCSPFLQALFFAIALMLALKLSKTSRPTRQQAHSH
ncbi:MAG: hypothetical protein WBP29_08550 [Candidatus Zixiibacteriota bacterium]